MQNYFVNCSTLDEVKATYRQLAKELHPDKGGTTEIMQELNKQYAFIIAKIAKEGKTKDGHSRTAEEVESEILAAEAYKEALDKVIHLEGITIELVGYWIWITGNTRPYASVKAGGNGILSEAGFWYASKKVAWYFRTDEFKSRNRSKMSLDQIKTKYGSTQIRTAQGFKLSA